MAQTQRIKWSSHFGELNTVAHGMFVTITKRNRTGSRTVFVADRPYNILACPTFGSDVPLAEIKEHAIKLSEELATA